MIGREKEIAKIERLFKSNRSEFLAVTGRRRVGKTYLIDQMLSKYYCFNVTGIQKGNMQMQLLNFANKLAEYKGMELEKSPDSWQILLQKFKSYLKTLSKDQKQVIFIDELPWVSTARSKFVQLLAHLWNDYLSKETHFILVICGSATSWITKKIINDPGGLHNRVTEIIHLYPFTLSETKTFLTSKEINLTNHEIAKIYMVLGGIPFYLENIRREESFSACIERICFAPTGLLNNEYINLYQALFSNSDIHMAIVGALAKHKNALTHPEILNKIEIDATGSYQRAIEELLLSNFIVEVSPFGKKKRGIYYRLTDEFSIFFHRFIKPNRKYTAGIWQQLAASQSYKIWAGYAFESLCYKHIDVIKKILGIEAVYTEISTLTVPTTKNLPKASEGFQIDLLIDRKDDSINLCEIKFHNGPFSINKVYYNQLIQKKQRFIQYTKTKKQVFLTMITNFDLAENAYASEVVDISITLDQIIQ